MTETVKALRKRGIIFILVAIPAWIFVYHFLNRVRQSAFSYDSYELGSVAMPYPAVVRLAQMFAVLSTLIGLSLFVFDFVRWLRRSHYSPSEHR